MNNQFDQYVKWRFDINAFRLLGRELITDRVTAIYELVKNCYDANAQNVDIEFIDVGTKKPNNKIIIRDDGIGMTFEDISEKWMVVGTNSKRKELFSPPPFRRRHVGEKGIGRFATDKLGGKLLIETKKEGVDFRLFVEINWNEYEDMALRMQSSLFTEYENRCWQEPTDKLDEHGTTLYISFVNDVWSKRDIERTYKELSKFISPFYSHDSQFNVRITSNDSPDFQKRPVESAIVQYASHSAELSFDVDVKSGKSFQEILKFDKKKGEIYKDKVEKPIFGFVKLMLYFFNTAAKAKYNKAFKDKDDRIDGIRIYRDGIITTPFAEYEYDPLRRRDILGIDKRLWQDTFTRIGSREVIGFVEITKEGNPQIIDSTNRQDFVDTMEYRELKQFIIEQLNVFSEVKIFERSQKILLNTESYEEAISDLKRTDSIIQQIEKKNPQLATELSPLKNQLKTVILSSQKHFEKQQDVQKEFLRKENIYLSLMSLQDYAVTIAHAVRTSVGKILRMAEFFNDRFPNPTFENQFKTYAIKIYHEMLTLNKVTDFMLSYAGSNLDFQELDIKQLIESLFEVYSFTFQSEKIETLVEVEQNLILFANRKFFEEIIQNLVSNSIKVLKNNTYKLIKFSGFAENDKMIFYFSDNGPGISENIREKVFELYYTETANEGGAGVGLFIVKTRIESLNGEITVVDNELSPTGATFKIILPFKKK
jgi:signal transduction histidine kinase